MANYSAPMHAIGLYIAAASFVCFLFLVFDICSGFRNRNPWLPCRFFSLNSLTTNYLSSLFLVNLWGCFIWGTKLKDWFSDGIGNSLIKGEKSTMMHRLVLCHVDCYFKNPQAVISTTHCKKTTGGGCLRLLLFIRNVAQEKCKEERERWTKVMKMKSPTPFSSYIQRFYETHKSLLPDQYRVSYLSLVILNQKAANKLERQVARSLVCAFDEVFKIIYFIDKKMSTSIFDKEEKKVAKVLWTKIWDLKNLQDYDSWEPFFKPDDDDFVSQEKAAVERLFDDSNNNIQQLFVDMICSFFAKLPWAILKDVAENRLGDHEERLIQRAIQYLVKFEKLDGIIQWEFPSETNITNLITPQSQVSSSVATVHQSLELPIPIS